MKDPWAGQIFSLFTVSLQEALTLPHIDYGRQTARYVVLDLINNLINNI